MEHLRDSFAAVLYRLATKHPNKSIRRAANSLMLLLQREEWKNTAEKGKGTTEDNPPR